MEERLLAAIGLLKEGMDQQFAGLDKQLTKIDRQLEKFMEAQGRGEAEKLFGPGYSKSLLARSVCDLTYLIPDNVFDDCGEEGAELPRRLALVERVGERLVEKEIPEKLLRSIAAKLEVRKVPTR